MDRPVRSKRAWYRDSRTWVIAALVWFVTSFVPAVPIDWSKLDEPVLAPIFVLYLFIFKAPESVAMWVGMAAHSAFAVAAAVLWRKVRGRPHDRRRRRASNSPLHPPSGAHAAGEWGSLRSAARR